MPVTGSTIFTGNGFRRVFGLISSGTDDSTLLTLAHGFAGLDATTATQLIECTFEPVVSSSPYGWFVSSRDATNVILGRAVNVAGQIGAASTVAVWCHCAMIHSLIK